MSTTSGPKGDLGTTYLVDAAVVKNRFVKQGTDQDHVIQGTAAAVTVGIATDNQDNVNKTVSVLTPAGAQRTVRIQAGAAFALGAKLTSDATGRGVLATTGQPVGAIAMEPCTAADQLIVCRVVDSFITLAP
jgi:hypothetical protein